MTPTADAARWLCDYLAEQGESAPAGDVLDAGARAGWSPQTLRAAHAALGVRRLWRLHDEGRPA